MKKNPVPSYDQIKQAIDNVRDALEVTQAASDASLRPLRVHGLMPFDVAVLALAAEAYLKQRETP